MLWTNHSPTGDHDAISPHTHTGTKLVIIVLEVFIAGKKKNGCSVGKKSCFSKWGFL